MGVLYGLLLVGSPVGSVLAGSSQPLSTVLKRQSLKEHCAGSFKTNRDKDRHAQTPYPGAWLLPYGRS